MSTDTSISEQTSDTPAENQPENPADNPETAALVRSGMREVVARKISLSDLFGRIVSPPEAEVPDLTPPAPPTLTEEVIEAIERLPIVFGRVVPKKNRALTAAELYEIVNERVVVDTVLAVLKERKDHSIREALANHADHQIPEDEQEGLRKDKNGHWAPWETQNIEVPGTNLKVQRFASGGKPNLTIGNVEQMLDEGVIDRKTYLSITSLPENPRVLDETKLHAAIQKDPRLLFTLAAWAEPTLPTTTVKVVKA